MKWPLAILTACALIITGCATDSDQSSEEPAPMVSESTSPSPTDEALPPATPREMWKQAVDSTQQADALTIDVQLITNVEGFERIVAGAGYVEVSRGFGDITWTDDLGTTREVITGSGHFLELDETWLELAGDRTLPTTVAFNPLAGLDDATNVVVVGTEDVEGTTTTRLDADLDASAGLTTMGFSEEERTVFSDAPEASLIATIWINADDQIVRVLREYKTSSIDGDPISATSLYLLSIQGQAQPIDVPETADALPAPL